MRGRLFLFGSVLVVFLMLMVPSIGAVEYNIAEKVNKDFLSRETHRFINGFRVFNNLFKKIIQLKGSNVLSVDLSFLLTVLVACVVVPTILLTIGFFFSDLFHLAGMYLVSGVVSWLTIGVVSFYTGLISNNLFNDEYSYIGVLLLVIDYLMAFSIVDLLLP